MSKLKIVSWNIEHLERLLKPELNSTELRRKDAIQAELHQLNPDIFCLLEGPPDEGNIQRICDEMLGGAWLPVKAGDGIYDQKGTQWIWFLVRASHASKASLLPARTWDALAGESWKVHYWGEFEDHPHKHYRHPQVMVFNWGDFRVEFAGLHLKSKFINKGKSLWEGGPEKRREFVLGALTARIKMTTEAANVRAYIDAKFNQVANPAIFVMGDFNDGPGKEYFEERYLFFDLISNIQGDIFAASRYLEHALYNTPDHLRWSVNFKDFVIEEGMPPRDPHILLDHILYTRGLGDASLPWYIEPNAGMVEHEIHALVNAGLPSGAQTSDHKPISLVVTTKQDL